MRHLAIFAMMRRMPIKFDYNHGLKNSKYKKIGPYM